MITRGKFIVFEGGEGTGKSTQAKSLADSLTANGVQVHLTREPGGSPEAEAIRELLISGEPERWLPMSEVLLFFAARYDHVQRLIKPHLQQGTWVISDRFLGSSYAYQGTRGVSWDAIDTLAQMTMGSFRPDMTILLDLDPKIGLERAHKRGVSNRFERFPMDYHQALRLNYHKALPSAVVVDANRSLPDVTEAVWAEVRKLL